MIDKTPEQLREDFWNEDYKNGAIIRSQYEEIKRVLSQQDMEWVEKQYKAIKQHAIDKTEFYSKYTVNDDFPVVDKNILLESYDKFKAKDGFMMPIHISSTSGSTGTPFSVVQDYKKRKRTIADLKVFGELCDYPSHEKMLYFRILSAKLYRTQEQEERENIFYIDSSDLGKKHLKDMLDKIIEKKPRIIFSYSSTIIELAKFAQSLNMNHKNFSMKSVLTGGEGISEENRILAEKAFGCKVYRRYSDMELGIFGQDMGDGGSYYLNYGSYYFEFLKLDSNEPAESGEVCRIVVTDLFNYAFPMIRYDTGDLGIMEEDENGGFPRLKEIYGRKRDCIYTVDGTLISPAKVFVMMWGLENVKQWQFIQETKNEYRFLVNTDKKIDYIELMKKFKAELGKDAQITVERVNEIPVLSSNKRRAVICNYKKN